MVAAIRRVALTLSHCMKHIVDQQALQHRLVRSTPLCEQRVQANLD
jgi:hypothetical protein